LVQLLTEVAGSDPGAGQPARPATGPLVEAAHTNGSVGGVAWAGRAPPWTPVRARRSNARVRLPTDPQVRRKSARPPPARIHRQQHQLTSSHVNRSVHQLPAAAGSRVPVRQLPL